MSRIDYEITGAGPPLLLLGPMSTSREVWDGIKEWLNPHFQCIAIDYCGINRSGGPPSREVSEEASEVSAFLAERGLRRVATVGWSFGGCIAQTLMAAQPHRISGAVLIASFDTYTPLQHLWADARGELARSTLSPESRMLFDLPWGFTPRLFADPQNAAHLIRAAARGPAVSADVSDAHLAAARRFKTPTILGSVAPPTLILVGELDILTPPVQAQALVRQISGARLQILPDGGHAMPIELCAPVADAVTEFLLPGRSTS